MGTRSQVQMLHEGIFLYQHWDGYCLPEIVQEALKKKMRWDDPEYLTRIIFSTMIKDHIEDETGYGISTSQHGDIEWLVEVDTKKQEITVKEGYNQLDKIWNGSFDGFIEADMSEEALTK